MSCVEALLEQYDHCWKMLADGIEKCPDDQWKSVVDDDFFVPARIVFHIIQTLDFYSEVSAEGFDWNAFGFNWEEDGPERFPDKSRTIEYLEKVKSKSASAWIVMGDEVFTGSDKAFAPWFKSPFARVVYGLRHSHHHIGQLSLDLQRRGLPEITW